MDIIEKLAKEQLKNAEQQPPANVWNTIEGRLDAVQATKTSKTRNIGRFIVIASGIAVAAAATLFAISKSNDTIPQSQPTITYQPIEEIVVEEPLDSAEKATDNIVARPTILEHKTVEAPSTKSTTAPKAALLTADQKKTTAFATAQNETTTVPQPVPNNKVAESNLPSTPAVDSAKIKYPTTQPEPRDTVTHRKTELSVVIPNLLTPNGDGYNDCWAIPDIENYGTVQVQVYTAKSKRIFSSTKYHNEFCGDNCPDGNYFYVIKFSDYETTRRGFLVIKR